VALKQEDSPEPALPSQRQTFMGKKMSLIPGRGKRKSTTKGSTPENERAIVVSPVQTYRHIKGVNTREA